MSFRTRLTSFFVLIVVIPMLAVGFLVFRLIGDSQQGKADARANGVATAAASLYDSESASATGDARTVLRALARSRRQIAGRATSLASQAGLARVSVRVNGRSVADAGVRSAVAPGRATAQVSGLGRMTVAVSELTAGEYARNLAGPGIAVVVREGSKPLTSTLGKLSAGALPGRGKTQTLRIHGAGYRAVTLGFPGFGKEVAVTILSALSGTTSGSVTGSRVLAAAFIVAVLLLAMAFAVMASRGLQGQLSRFLQAAKRLAGGDFSSPIQTEGHDEFAALGEEFNNMSSQLERRLEELSQERIRLHDAVQRIGQTFASNLDRPALLELALKTAVDAVQASCGRVSTRPSESDKLTEVAREGSLDGLDEAILKAESEAMASGDTGRASSGEAQVLTVPLGPPEPGARVHGLITVVRQNGAFSDDDLTVLRSLAGQAAMAMENVDLHMQVSRQAVTDELTGLSNHRRFQELLALEMEQVRRYHYPVGLIMLDIDNFKTVNDTYGHQQGDVVLRRVARVLADTSREVDYPARYGGEELALILPHTDMPGSYAIAERIRTAIESMRISRVDQEGMLRVTASLGVAASTDGSKEDLIAEADNALYKAKRQGKNRTIKAAVKAANVSGGG
jgi:diguanylate cyclase (GGDEF)-like protein